MEFYAKPKRLSLTPISVSIPNEMGFYATQRSICKMINCFNSQRDGILLHKRTEREQHYFVSIPNGMEFYYRDNPLD